MNTQAYLENLLLVMMQFALCIQIPSVFLRGGVKQMVHLIQMMETSMELHVWVWPQQQESNQMVRKVIFMVQLPMLLLLMLE